MQSDDKALGVEGVSEEDMDAYLANYKGFTPGRSSQDVVAHYNQWAESETGSYEEDICPKRYSGPRIAAETVTKYFTVREHANIKILDVAAGTGLVCKELFKLGYTYVDALDPSAGMLAVARQRGLYKNYILGSMGNKQSSIHDDVYDAMTIAGGLGEGHIPCEGLRDMARVVKPGPREAAPHSDRRKPSGDMQSDDKALGVEGVSEEDMDAYLANYKGYTPGWSFQEVVAHYNQWAESETGSYEEDSLTRCFGPRIAAETVNKYFTVREHANIKILDVAAGTGLVCKELFKLGYTNVDALDPSAGMLAVARQKGIYKDYIIGSMGNKPSSIHDDVYDAMTIAGGLGEGHIPCEGLRDMARVVKPGGVAVITIREEYMDYVEEYKDRLEPFMEQMEMEGKWRREERTVCPDYAFGKPGVVWAYRVTA